MIDYYEYETSPRKIDPDYNNKVAKKNKRIISEIESKDIII